MEPLGVEIDNLYSFVRDNAVPYVDMVHYTPEGSRMIAVEVVRVIDRRKSRAEGHRRFFRREAGLGQVIGYKSRGRR